MAVVDDQRAQAPRAGGEDARLRRVWEAIERPDVKVLSTDVFDTLLWRQVRDPVDAFPIVGRRLQARGWLDAQISPAAFGRLREAAERTARAELATRTGEVEVRLDEVYALLPRWVFASVSPEEALEAELEVERDLLVPDLDVLAVLEAGVEAGMTVIAVSDTYFTGRQLPELLRQPAVERLRFTRIFTSCDHRTNKSGGLFRIALDEVGARPEQVLHLGDNELADVEHPSELGIATVHFERRPPALERVLPGERRLRVAADEGRSWTSAEMVAEVTALRGKVAARADGRALPTALRPYWEFGAVVYGPVFAGFAAWVSERASELEVRRVHCFMREGGFLADLVERAGDRVGPGPGIETSPLWLNRAVLSKAVIAEATPAELAPLLVRRRRPTVRGFLAGLGLSVVDLPRFASHADTSLDDVTTRTNLLDAIGADPGARAKVLEESARARERVVRYVDGLLDGGNRLVTVDLGWAGSAQGLLNAVLVQAGRPEIDVVGLYLLNHEGAAERILGGQRLYGFLGEVGTPEEAVRLVVRSPEVLEQVCMPDHGSQVDLDGEGRPVLEATAPGRMQAVEAEAVRRGIIAFQREWVRYQVAVPGKLGRLEEARDYLRSLLVRSVTLPTEQEAALFGRWHHDENQGSDRSELIADPAFAERLRYLDPGRLQGLPMEDIYWPFALASRVDAEWAQLIAAAASGELAWEGLAADVETGRFEVAITRGTDVDPDGAIRTVPRRNRFGLSYVGGTLRAPAIGEVTIRPSEHPCVLRFDFLELRCAVQGSEALRVLRFDAPEHFAQLRRVNLFAINPNVFVVHGSDPGLVLDLGAHLPQTTFRVEVSCGFSALPISQLIPTPGRVRNVEEAGVVVERLERILSDMRGSASWRLTRPLRAAKRVAGS